MSNTASLVTALSTHLASSRERDRLPAIAAAALLHGEVVWRDACGVDADGSPVGLDHQFRIGSITKTITAVEVLRLRDEGALALTDPIGAHLPELGHLAVSIAQLLTHTSGMQAETNGPWWERSRGVTWPELVALKPRLALTPGTRFHYSNVGFAILGELVARLRRTSWWEAVQSGVLAPLGMSRTTYAAAAPAATGLAVHPQEPWQLVEPAEDAGAMAPAGQLWATVGDLATWAQFVANGNDAVLSTASLREMQVPLAIDDKPGQAWMTAQGLGWRVWGTGSRRFLGHGGSMPGFLATVKVDPASGLGVVLATNSTNGLGHTVDELIELLLTHERPVVVAPGLPTADVESLAGEWFWGPERFVLAPTGGDTFILGNGPAGRTSRFVRDGEAWVGLDTYFAGERLHVVADDQLELASFVLTREPYPHERWYPAPSPQ